MQRKKRYVLLFGAIRFLSLATMVLLWISLLGIVIPPHFFPPLGLATLLMPPLFIAHNLFLIFYLLRGKTYAFILIITSFFTISSFHSWISLGPKEDIVQDAPTFSLMSFNVRMFNVYDWIKDPEVPQKIARQIAEKSPDILCVQEFYSFDKTPKFDYPEGFEYFTNPGRNFGLAIYSRFPMLAKGAVEYERTEGFNNYFIYADLLMDKDTVRIINAHLASFYFDVKDFDKLKSASSSEEIQNSVLSLGRSLFRGFSRRSLQLQTLKDFIDASPYPIIIAGDMNDVPASYSYRILNRRFTDAFRTAGKGIGRTYIETRFPLRIDWVFYDDASFQATYFETLSGGEPLSDHWPVFVRFAK